MAYSTSNPPKLISKPIGGAGTRKWSYESADAIADVDATDYFTNASDLGMQTGDVIEIFDTTNGLVTVGKITVDADGNGTASAFTAFP